MATPRQKKLAKAIVLNQLQDKPQHIKDVLESVGYPISTAESQAKRVIEQKGVVKELASLGFHEDNAKRVVGEILNTGEDTNRLKAADMVFKVNATYAPERQEIKQTTVNISFFSNPKIQEATRLYEEQLKQAIINDETNKPVETLPHGE